MRKKSVYEVTEEEYFRKSYQQMKRDCGIQQGF